MQRKYKFRASSCQTNHGLRRKSTSGDGQLHTRKLQTSRAALAISACSVGKPTVPYLKISHFNTQNVVKILVAVRWKRHAVPLSSKHTILFALKSNDLCVTHSQDNQICQT